MAADIFTILRQKKTLTETVRVYKDWQRLTFPPDGSIISAIGLNFSVRNGKRWTPMQ